MKIVGRILKYTALLLVFGIIALLLGRIILAEYYPKSMKELAITDSIRARVQEDGSLTVHTQDLRASYDNPNFALFMANHLYYIPELGELQITLRYNNSTLREMQAHFGLKEVPEASLDLFSFSVVDHTAVDENGKEVEDGGNRVYPSSISTESKFMYQYIKLTFTGISFEDADWLRLDIAYTGTEAPVDKNAASRWPAHIAIWERELIPYEKTFTVTEKDLAS